MAPAARNVQRDDLIASCMPLARALARRYAHRGEPLDDLEQVAMVGLIKAAQRFDPAFGTQFSTFATATITGELKRHYRDTRWGLRTSRSLQERYLLVRDAVEWTTQDLGRSPTIAEIAAAADLTEDQVLEAMETGQALSVGSLDRHPLLDDDAPTEVGGVDAGIALTDDRVTLSAALEVLTRREQLLLRMRFIDDLSQSAIAAELGVSQMQVSRLLARALSRLRQAVGGAGNGPDRLG
jgi:RNA polymerase sigma-B factor